MSILIDTDLRSKTSSQPPTLVLGVDTQNIENQVQGCAVDIRIGDIFRPGTKEGKIGSASNPRSSYQLREGETAVIRTIETFKLDREHAAFVFPAASVSLKGLLMTNPGHVDPGYEGNLHVTVINMSRGIYDLKRGQRFLRAILYKLDNPVTTPSTLINQTPINTELLELLSPDFLSVDKRISTEFRNADIRTRIWQVVIPAGLAILASLFTSWLNNNSLSKEFTPKFTQLEQQMKVETRIATLENNAKVDMRFIAIENKLNALASNSRHKNSKPK